VIKNGDIMKEEKSEFVEQCAKILDELK